MKDAARILRPLYPTELWWYLSFAGEEGFRGAAFVDADDFGAAVQRAWHLGINPGGECRGYGPLDSVGLPAPKWRRRLLSKAELECATGPIARWPDDGGDVACDDCQKEPKS